MIGLRITNKLLFNKKIEQRKHVKIKHNILLRIKKRQKFSYSKTYRKNSLTCIFSPFSIVKDLNNSNISFFPIMFARRSQSKKDVLLWITIINEQNFCLFSHNMV